MRTRSTRAHGRAAAATAIAGTWAAMALVAACGASQGRGAAAGGPGAGTADGATAPRASAAGGPADAEAPLPPLETIAARAAIEAPGMHEAQRTELTLVTRIDDAGAGPAAGAVAALATDAAPPATGWFTVTTDVLRAPTTDACARVLFAATNKVTAELVDAKGTVVVPAGEARLEGGLGDRGPACTRRGGTLTARFTGPERARVRLVVWSSP